MTAPPPRQDDLGVRRGHTVVARGLASGTVAAASLLGMLVGFGRRTGTAFRPLNATAHTLLGTRADDVWGFNGVVTIVGVAVVLVLSAMTGILVARLAPSFRTLRALIAAAGVALVGYFLHLYVAARSPGGLSALLSFGELRALYVTLAIALVLGMRFAFSPGTSAHRH
ncbi:MAG: hypothetical protein ABIP93_05150 [Gemmatimonadaceae bacterium]